MDIFQGDVKSKYNPWVYSSYSSPAKAGTLNDVAWAHALSSRTACSAKIELLSNVHQVICLTIQSESLYLMQRLHVITPH